MDSESLAGRTGPRVRDGLGRPRLRSLLGVPPNVRATAPYRGDQYALPSGRPRGSGNRRGWEREMGEGPQGPLSPKTARDARPPRGWRKLPGARPGRPRNGARDTPGAWQLLTAPGRRPRGARGAVPAPRRPRKPAALKGRDGGGGRLRPQRALPAPPPPCAAGRCAPGAGGHRADAVPRGLRVGGGGRVGPSPSGSPKISRLPNPLPG